MVKDVEKGAGEASGSDHDYCGPHEMEAAASEIPLPMGDETEYSALIASSDAAEQLQPDSSKSIGYQSFPTATVTAIVSRRPERVSNKGWDLYNLHLEKYPLLVKSLTAFFILGLADACAQICQQILYGTSATSMAWDWLRTLRFGIFGLVGAPWSHYFYHGLDTVLPPTTDPWTRVTLFKVFIDQFVQAPILLAVMIVGLNIMEGQGISAIEKDLQDRYWISLVANWKLWLPASLVNMVFVKPSLRVLFVNVVFFVWTIILSIILNVDSSR